ncbi:WD repeat-containing protein mip1 [Blumeria hordei DH14]|uniref:WD repeat-containing protein mip1 n=1 Tax=Blumeria graminis f. sp. hordei (strain DH14) TaxID=546991 RepID=N1JI86_BLUG1|nr:WD repeat-containing protein mip1 [Blumeria hordei DH14]
MTSSQHPWTPSYTTLQAQRQKPQSPEDARCSINPRQKIALTSIRNATETSGLRRKELTNNDCLVNLTHDDVKAPYTLQAPLNCNIAKAPKDSIKEEEDEEGNEEEEEEEEEEERENENDGQVETGNPGRRLQPSLQRTRSDVGPRFDELDLGDHCWSARHGFEDHYASEEYVSQLANFSPAPIGVTIIDTQKYTIFRLRMSESFFLESQAWSPASLDSRDLKEQIDGHVDIVLRSLHNRVKADRAQTKILNIKSCWPGHALDEWADDYEQNWYMYFTDKRHETTGNPKLLGYELQDWRMKDRLKTISAALAICLNIGIEPPDQLKTNPGSKLEAWQDPTHPPVQKALENIGKSLQAQYETLSIRTRYKQYLDPSVEETKKFCQSLRRNAKEERVLFHYNGHGVPKPTSSGEIWVFNKNYTQYIPVSLYDLQTWLQAPTFYVWDCSDAGNILNNFHRFVDKHKLEESESIAKDKSHVSQVYEPYIHLAACSVKENLPTNPLLPADVFTSCLTTPIEMALWFFVLNTPLKTQLTPERAKKLPGRLQERRTPLGELNWIFTAITDTIAWTSLPRPLFRRFFRQDLMVAALFRNFLLSQRIMAAYNCHPQSYPQLPDTHHHPLWASWDFAVEMALSQLPMLEEKEAGNNPDYEFQNSSFFTEQLTAFEVYLTQAGSRQKPPEQLPVVLQVLLSQQHRVRALILLGKFLDMGPWAVNLALSIGIFPYVLKLLQSAAHELKPVMVFIWTRVLAVDISCQADLLKDNGYMYFASILKPNEGLPVVDSLEHKAMCAFILSRLCEGYNEGQNVCNQTEIMSFCAVHLQNGDNPLLRQWACLCISQLWKDLPEAKWRGIKENVHTNLALLIRDSCCEVRAAMLYAMSTFIGTDEVTDEVARVEINISWTVIDMAYDGNAMVRKELLIYLSKFIYRYENKFLVTAHEQLCEERDSRQRVSPEDEYAHRMGLHFAKAENRNSDGTIKDDAQGISHNSIFATIWKHVLIMAVDPHPEVQQSATIIIDYIYCSLFQSPIGKYAEIVADEINKRSFKPVIFNPKTSDTRPTTPTMQNSNSLAPHTTGILKRTASYLFAPFGVTTGENSSIEPQAKPGLKSPGLQRNSFSIRARPYDLNAPHEFDEAGTTPGSYHTAKEPTSGAFRCRNLTEAPIIPLTSKFLEWSIEYFREPQMKPNEAEEPGSSDYNERLWRRSRNEAILRDTQPQKEIAGSGKWTIPSGFLNNQCQPSKMVFHQFEDHLAVVDDRDTVCVWDWKSHDRLSKFSNGNPEGSKISDIQFINEDDQAFLMIGSSDGVVRIYRNYESEKKIEIASAWRALTDLVPRSVNYGMVFDWQQVSGRLLVAGDIKVIRVWSAANELCVADINARSGSCVTSLTSDQMTGNIFVAGFGDGAIRIFDARNRPQEAMVKRWKDGADKVWIKSVHMQRGGQREFLSASRDGRVKLWDIRMDQPLRTIRTTNQVLRTTSTHEHLPVFAVGTSNHTVKVFNFEGKELSRVQPYSNFLHQSKQSPISTTAFHPHRMMLACAARQDNHVNVFTCSEKRSIYDP